MQTRYCSRSLQTTAKINGETYHREWLVYYPRNCVMCKVFSKLSKNVSSTTALASSRFDDWYHPQIIQTHEISKSHMDSTLTYLTTKRAHKFSGKLDEMIKAE